MIMVNELTCFGEGVGDQLADEFVLWRPQQQDDVGWQHVSVLSQEPTSVVDHLGGGLGGKGQQKWPNIYLLDYSKSLHTVDD